MKHHYFLIQWKNFRDYIFEPITLILKLLLLDKTQIKFYPMCQLLKFETILLLDSMHQGSLWDSRILVYNTWVQ